jgi:putative endonuclease
MADRRELGRAGERAAERVLRRAGLTILARNWRAAGGELDLAALEGDTLVFVEVKTRRHGFSTEHARVSARQRRRITRAAHAFRRRFGVRHLPYRFDEVTIEGDPRRPHAVTWTRTPPAKEPQA